MTDKELIRGLRDVEIRYKDCFYSTGEVRVSDMARDCADRIEQLQAENSRLEKQLEAAVECIEEVEFSLATSRFSAAWAAIRKWRGMREEETE